MTKLEELSGQAGELGFTSDGVESYEETDSLNLFVENSESSIDHDIRHHSQDTVAQELKSSESIGNGGGSENNTRSPVLRGCWKLDRESDARPGNALNPEQLKHIHTLEPYNQDPLLR